jgi:hypothetical protein
MGLGHVDHLLPAPAHLFPTLIGDDAEEPRSDRAAGAHAAQLSPRPDRRLLYCVLREIGILKQSCGETMGRLDERREDRLKGPHVTTLCVDDELLVRGALHNFTLNTGGEAKSVSALSRDYK